MQAVDLVCNNKYTIYTKQNYVCMCVKPVVSSDTVYRVSMFSPLQGECS